MFPQKVSVSEECKDFIMGLLKKNVTERLGSAKAMMHEFIGGEEIRGLGLKIDDEKMEVRNSESLVSQLTTTEFSTTVETEFSDDDDDDYL